MAYKVPFRSLKENMILNQEGDVWAYYRIFPEEVSQYNQEKKEEFKRKWAYLFQKTLNRYEDFHLFMYPKDMQLQQRFERLVPDLDPRNPKIGFHYMNESVKALKGEMGFVTEDGYCIGVRIKNVYEMENPIEQAKRTLTDFGDRILSLLGQSEVVDDVKFDEVSNIEEDLALSLMNVKAQRLKLSEIRYLLRLNYLRNITHDAELESKKVLGITDTILDSCTHTGYLHLSSEEGESCISFVPIARFENMNIAYNHLFELAKNMNFPCEFHIKGHYKELDGLTGFSQKVSRTKKRFRAERKDANKSGESAGKKNNQGLAATEKLEDEIESGQPLIEWLACFVVYGKDQKECKKRSDSLIRILSNRDIEAFRPTADQLKLFYRLLFGSSIAGMQSWLQISNGQTLAETLFAVTNHVGNHVGWVIGRVDPFFETQSLDISVKASRNLVLFNAMVANQGIHTAKTDSPHIGITGETGKGKSYLTKLIFYYSSMQDMDILLIDPKKEMRSRFNAVVSSPYCQKHYPLFVEHLKTVHYVTLDPNDRANDGVLDPIVFLKGTDAKDTAQAMIESIYNLKDKDEIETAILNYITETIEEREMGRKVGLLTVVQKLMRDENEKVQKAGKLLNQKIQKSVLQLGFSDGSTTGLDLNSRLTVLEIMGLELPDSTDKLEEYTDIQKKSICLMLPLGKFCEKFGSSNPNRFTMEIFDEAWILTKAKGGKRILKQMRRVGRSQNNSLVYTTQSVKDVQDEDDHGNFGTIFAFDEPSEREEILSHLGLEVTDRNKKLLSGMLKGQCMMNDMYGRVAKISIHTPFEEFHKANETVDKTASAFAESAYI